MDEPSLTDDQLQAIKAKIAARYRQPPKYPREWVRLEGGPLDTISVGVSRGDKFWGWMVAEDPLTQAMYAVDPIRRGVFVFEGYSYPGRKESGG